MSSADTQIGKALLDEAKRRLFQESLPRIHKCLSYLTDEEIWYRPNPEVVSIGNLILHLQGNITQWIISGLGGAVDHRARGLEFSETMPIAKAKLLADLDQTMSRVHDTLHMIDPATLLEQRQVQGFRETGVSIIVHVVEHFSYHVGQITFAVKSRKAVNVNYYEGVDLSRKS